MRRRSLALVPIVLFLFASCSMQGSTATDPSPSSTPTPTGLPAVSLETTCDLLFGRDFASGPAPRSSDIILRLVEYPDGSTIDPSEVSDVLDSLQAVRETASDELLPYIDATIEPIAILDGIFNGTGENQSISFSDYKAASLELLNRCT